MNNLAAQLTAEITNETHIIRLLDDAAFAERFLSKPKPPKQPLMYDLITTSYSADEVGYYKSELKLRATPRQITRWEFAIDVLLLITDDICDDPLMYRKLFWLRANRFKWSKLARYFGYNRTTLKRKYQTVLARLSKKVRKEIKFDTLNRILYLI